MQVLSAVSEVFQTFSVFSFEASFEEKRMLRLVAIGLHNESTFPVFPPTLLCLWAIASIDAPAGVNGKPHETE